MRLTNEQRLELKKIADAFGLQEIPERLTANILARLEERQKAEAKRRVRCGAKTRKGSPCRCKSEPGKRRCKLHGGLSTGPKTAEGRACIALAQERRWQKWQESQQTEILGSGPINGHQISMAASTKSGRSSDLGE